MPKVTEAHRAARRHEIAAAAMKLFARKGFDATSVSDIIAESGLSAGAIYGNYKNKDDLISAAVGELMDRWMVDVQAARSVRPLLPPGEIIRTLVSGALREAGSFAVLLQVWAYAAGDPERGILTGRIVTAIRGMLRDYLRDWFAERPGISAEQASSAAGRLAPVYVGLVQGYVVQSTLFPEFDGEAYLAAVDLLTPDVAAL